MSEAHPSDGHPRSKLLRGLSLRNAALPLRIVSAFTLKHLGVGLAGTFAFAGVAVAIHNATANSAIEIDAAQSNMRHSEPAQESENGIAASPKKAASDTSSSSSGNDSSTSSHTNVQLDVNGQQVAVPDNEDSHQIISSDGSQTTVDSSSNSDGTKNSSRSSFNLNVTTRSSSSSEGS
jgi:hypothetical protein